MVFETLKETLRAYASRGGRVLGAATAFYAILSVAPVLLLAVVVTSVVTDRADARRAIVRDVSLWIGRSSAETIGGVLDHLAQNGHGPFAGALSLVVLLWASTRLFAHLRYSINHIWGVREVGFGISSFSWSALRQARRRLSALMMVLVVVVTLTLTVLGKAALAAAARYLGGEVEASWYVLEFGVSFAVLATLCVAVFKVLPSLRIGWRDAFIGAIATSLLFSAGAAGIGWYLGVQSTTSTYGAAGSFVALLLWVYYSAQAFFLGAAFTRVYAERHGDGLELLEGAVRVVEA